MTGPGQHLKQGRYTMTIRVQFRALCVALALVAAAMPLKADAAEFRWAAQGDAGSLDPHALAEGFTLSFLGNVYEGLVRRAKDLSLEPALATKWYTTEPSVWRFELRQGVTFHDGTPFTADDVVFSFERASADQAGIKGMLGVIKEVRKVDASTVDVVTPKPDPIMPQAIANWLIMSKSWAEKNGATTSSNVGDKVENFASINTNGTGPFKVVERVTDNKTVLEPFEGWWDTAEHNVTRAQFRPIKADATRVAALISGEVDMVFPVPLQDIPRIESTSGLKVLQGPELRTIFLAMDVDRDELLYSSVKGKNPFKDIRVRQAFYHAIDEQAIVDKVMRGAATPAGMLVGPGINGFNEDLNGRLPHDPGKAKALLASAGYPDGFEIGLDCPNNRYVNDERICQAIVGMLAKVGIKANLTAMPKSQYFAKLKELDTSFYLLGWTSGTYDAHHPMRFLMHTTDPSRKLGSWNFARVSDSEIDGLVDQIATEVDAKRRQTLIDQVHTRHRELVLHIPLHQQALAWAMADRVELVQRADNFFNLRWVTVQ